MRLDLPSDSFWSNRIHVLEERKKASTTGDFDKKKIDAMKARIEEWEKSILSTVLSETPERKDLFGNLSGIPPRPLGASAQMFSNWTCTKKNDKAAKD